MLVSDRFRILFFKQKTAYEMRISDWSSNVCSSDLRLPRRCAPSYMDNTTRCHGGRQGLLSTFPRIAMRPSDALSRRRRQSRRSEEHTSDLQSLMRISYALFCLKKKHPSHSTTHITSTSTIERTRSHIPKPIP